MHTWHGSVRDYELDIQGIVNNANYLNYFEHARHIYLIEHGIDCVQLHIDGKDINLIDCQVQYKKSLGAHCNFYINTQFFMQSRLRMMAKQWL